MNYHNAIDTCTNRILEVANRIAKFWVQQRKEDGNDLYGIPVGDIKYHHIYTYIFDNILMVVVNWEEYWNYGGYDKGDISFDAKYIFDEEALVKYLTPKPKEVILDYSI